MTDPTIVFPVQASDLPSWHNVLAVYDGASLLERRRGLEFYERAWDLSRALAECHWHRSTQRRTTQAAAIVAACSQLAGWDRTVELALKAFKRAGDINGGSLPSVATKTHQLFYGGHPDAVLSGPMVTSLYRAITTQGRCADVPVDRHLAHIVYGEILSDRERGAKLRVTTTRDGYSSVVRAVTEATVHLVRRDHISITPAQLAVTVVLGWKNVLLGEERGFTAAEREEKSA